MARVLVLAFFGAFGIVSSVDEFDFNMSSSNVSCRGAYSKVENVGQLYDNLITRVVLPRDSSENITIKRGVVQYLTRTPLFLDMINCNFTEEETRGNRLLQEDEDGDDDGGGGGGGAAGAAGGGALDNTNVVNGVRRILANVFTGNLVGIIQESVGLRSPEGVTSVFTDVLSTLFGSAATAGVTGIIGNISTTAVPMVMNVSSSTLPPGYEAYVQQHYLQQQYFAQQLQLQQQQQLLQGNRGAAATGGAGALLLQQQQQLLQGGGVGNLGTPSGGAGALLLQQQQLQQQQQHYLLSQGQGGNRRRPGLNGGGTGSRLVVTKKPELEADYYEDIDTDDN